MQAACRGSNGAISPIGGGQPATLGDVVIKLQADRVETPKISLSAE